MQIKDNSIAKDKIWRILIVDDDQDMLWVLEDFLTDEGYKVVSVNSGEKAIKEAGESKFDLIILDIAMPKMNGIETLERIKAIVPDIKTIMITAFRDEDMIKEAYKQGAINCVYKPFDLKHMRKIVRQILNS